MRGTRRRATVPGRRGRAILVDVGWHREAEAWQFLRPARYSCCAHGNVLLKITTLPLAMPNSLERMVSVNEESTRIIST